MFMGGRGQQQNGNKRRDGERLLPQARAAQPVEKRGTPCAPLSRHKAGDAVRIVEIGGDKALKRRLRNLGLRPGKAIEVCQESPAGMVVAADGLKLALAPDAAREVIVEERADAPRP